MSKTKRKQTFWIVSCFVFTLFLYPNIVHGYIELFEMVNEENGGVKTLVNNTTVYQILSETPALVIKITSIEEQKQFLQKDFEKLIRQDLVNGNREERARAVYMAICLDMNSSLAKSNSKQ